MLIAAVYKTPCVDFYRQDAAMATTTTIDTMRLVCSSVVQSLLLYLLPPTPPSYSTVINRIHQAQYELDDYRYSDVADTTLIKYGPCCEQDEA